MNTMSTTTDQCKDDTIDPSQLRAIKTAIMSALGILECTSTDSRDGDGGIPQQQQLVSGDCNPIRKMTSECDSGNNPVCGRLLNQQSVCAVVSEILGVVYRGCNATTNAQGIVQKHGGCNADIVQYPTQQISCDDLQDLALALAQFIHTMSCISENIDVTDQSNIVNEVTFTLANSYCKNGIHVTQESIRYPKIEDLPSTQVFADMSIEIIKQCIILIKKMMGGDGTGGIICDDIMDELSRINMSSVQHDIGVTLNIYFSAYNDLEVKVINSYIDGVCKASQKIVYDMASRVLVNSGITAAGNHCPSLSLLQQHIQLIPVKPRSQRSQTFFLILVILLLLLLLLGILLYNKSKRKTKLMES